jgi:hypothetical protein
MASGLDGRRVPASHDLRRVDGGFSHVEFVVVLGLAVGLFAVLWVMGDRQRRTAMLGEDLSNMRRIAALTGQYAADNDDKFWTFSWQGGVKYNSEYPDLNFASEDNTAASNQAVVILRDHAGRPDMPMISGWYSYGMYSHLPLLQHAGLESPNRLFVSAGDRARQLWVSDPLGFDLNNFKPNQPDPTGQPMQKRWPYSSSYQLASSFFDQTVSATSRIRQGGTEPTWFIPPDADLHAKTLSSTAFPSQKVHLHDKYAWHFGKTAADSLPTFPLGQGYPYFAEPHARLPLLFVDGHAAMHQSGSANEGWIPNNPTSCLPTTFSSPSSGKTVSGRYRWTRSYLDGRDVGGPEVGDCLK